MPSEGYTTEQRLDQVERVLETLQKDQVIANERISDIWTVMYEGNGKKSWVERLIRVEMFSAVFGCLCTLLAGALMVLVVQKLFT